MAASPRWKKAQQLLGKSPPGYLELEVYGSQSLMEERSAIAQKVATRLPGAGGLWQPVAD